MVQNPKSPGNMPSIMQFKPVNMTVKADYQKRVQSRYNCAGHEVLTRNRERNSRRTFQFWLLSEEDYKSDRVHANTPIECRLCEQGNIIKLY